MRLLSEICLILGVFCILYYGIILIYAGKRSTFSWFWITTGIGSILLGISLRTLRNNDIELPIFFRILISIVFVVGISMFLLIEVTIIHYSSMKAEQGLDYLIILGAQVKEGKISKTLQRRLDAAIEYIKVNPKTLIIVSGGKEKKELISEAEAMKQYLVESNIENKKIIMEDKSANTKENICFCKSLLKTNTSVALVTNGFHMYRSLMIAKKLGLHQIQGLAAPTDHILSINYYVREAIGIMKDKIWKNL